ncbi:MAG: hypothetical protein HY681_15460 [Chloroflexi bacterium]|nr:hypothetical protein [Chloroflexota bacterium]
MKTSAFVVLLLVVLVWGGTVGGAFAGGIALGKSRAEASNLNVAAIPSPSTPTPAAPQGTGGPLTPEQRDQLRQQFRGQDGQGAPLSQEQLDQLRQQFQGSQGGQGGFGGGGGIAGRGLTGTVEKVEGDVLTVNTPQGPLSARISETTQIRTLATGKPSDLSAGVRVQVTGQRAEDGSLEARTVVITPEGLEGALLGPAGGARGG